MKRAKLVGGGVVNRGAVGVARICAFVVREAPVERERWKIGLGPFLEFYSIEIISSIRGVDFLRESVER